MRVNKDRAYDIAIYIVNLIYFNLELCADEFSVYGENRLKCAVAVLAALSMFTFTCKMLGLYTFISLWECAIAGVLMLILLLCNTSTRSSLNRTREQFIRRLNRNG